MSFFEIDSRFLIDTAFHRLEIIRDDGLYRHLRMQQPGTSCYYYDVITWPGYLTVTGDMGTWTFSRIADMFDFFGAWKGGINTHYWAEKLEAGAGCSAREMLAKEYDHDAFCKSLKESLSDYLDDDESAEPEEDEDWDDDDDTPDSDKAVVREIVRDLCRAGFNNEWEAYQAIYDADWPKGWSAWDVCDGLTFKTYTSHFRWILFAITWAISKYHNAKIVDKAMATFLAVKGVQA
ncbi:MAG: hypothetical protein E7C46_23070 [Klebsiella grimontii]|uniref:hypothetical protein n=1 Tax=Klebsiella grimontii TaxID=2058152 RepID=UPI000665E6D5|nr:hypothetical protein [Klebsiella grimontii]EMD6905862.1 hypothetical protein [Citrobacter freundii]HCB0953733.1 hypothetical protein [Klebsiella pneumoniae]HDX9095485.1 hypothetical protein [Klebsiella michiganensis]MBZ7272988.1 hypothetical protein [Klebsiella grimontii]MDU2707917.1 hypothetical protein [Klebsiella grimontii]